MKIHIAIGQYEFIEEEVETLEEARLVYDEVNHQFTAGEGLTPNEYNKCLDEFLESGTVKGGRDMWEKMNKEQQEIMQIIKRSMKRLEAKTKKV